MKKLLVSSFICISLLIILSIPGSISAESGKIKIGFAHVFTGGMATFGQVAKQGVEIAVEEINNNGGILGRQVEIIYEDTQVNPEASKEAIKRLVEKGNVSAVVGIVSSAVGVAEPCSRDDS